jgi:hypothetical protein
MNINGVVYSAPTENGEPKLGAFPRIWVARESFDIAGKPCHGSERIRSFDNTGKETYHHYICTYYIYQLTRYLPIIKNELKNPKLYKDSASSRRPKPCGEAGQMGILICSVRLIPIYHIYLVPIAIP